MNVPKLSDLDSPKKTAKPYLNKHYPEFTQYLEQQYPGVSKFSAAVYLYFHHIEPPVCPICGNPVPFLDSTRGFQKYCSRKCANSSPEFIASRRSTNINKYGTPEASQSIEVKNKIKRTFEKRYGGMGNAVPSIRKKQQDTLEKRYGVRGVLQNPEFLQQQQSTIQERYGGPGMSSPIIRNKIKSTNQKKYGVDCVFSSPDIRNKIKSTNQKKYGTLFPTQNPQIAQKISKTKTSSFLKTQKDILHIHKDDKDIWYTCACPHPECTKCEEHTYVISASRYCNRRLDGTEPCTKIIPVLSGRNTNTYPEKFIQSILEECTQPQQLILHNRSLISPLEVDIYDPIHSLAIECNGCYWHSDLHKGASYHKQKFEACQKKGVQLLTIWEDWIKTKPEIVKSLIKSKYHIYQRSIYGRQCEVQNITGKEANEFYDRNHIQGATRAQIHYGLFFQGELVSAMSFSKPRGCMGKNIDSESVWELVRFCSILNTQVIGAAGKLMSRFVQENKPDQIISFSSNDISDGGLYKKLGFQKMGESKSYWYIGKDYQRYHRSNFTKAGIIRKGLAPAQEIWTEAEAMMLHGFVRIYDSGQTKWVWKMTDNIL